MTLEDRIERLELENRRIKLACGVVVAVLAGVLLGAAVTPQETPGSIEAREFRVVDSEGQLRAALHVQAGQPMLHFYDRHMPDRPVVTLNPAILSLNEPGGGWLKASADFVWLLASDDSHSLRIEPSRIISDGLDVWQLDR